MVSPSLEVGAPTAVTMSAMITPGCAHILLWVIPTRCDRCFAEGDIIWPREVQTGVPTVVEVVLSTMAETVVQPVDPLATRAVAHTCVTARGKSPGFP